MSWKKRGVYVWRTRKPHAVLGLGMRVMVPAAVVLAWVLWAYGARMWWVAFALVLFSGRHTAYVGQTSSRFHRDEQHITGKPWADLDPKVYPIPSFFPRWKAAREAQEAIWIWLLWPVYNVQLNRHNPRRIKPDVALRQRVARQSHSWMWIGPKLARAALTLLLLAGANAQWFHMF